MRVNFASFRAQAFGARAVPRCVARSQTSLQSSFLGSRLSLSQRQSVPGFVNVRPTTLPGRRTVTVEANGKRCLGDTLHGTRRARTRTSGFRARRLTVGGRKVLRARKKRGRKLLCPANSNTGVKSTASSNRKSTNKAYRVNRDRARFYTAARGFSKVAKGEHY